MKKLINYACTILLLFSSCNIVFANNSSSEITKTEGMEDVVNYEVKELGTVDEFINSFKSSGDQVQDKAAINISRRVGSFHTDTGTAYISMLTIDGEFAYCLEPYVYVQEGSGYESTTDFENLSFSTKKRIWSIASFGYGYKGDYSDEMFIASQIMIWDAVGFTVEPHYTDGESYGEYWDISSARDTIEWRISSGGKRPSFHNKEYDVKFKEPFTITDSNGVLGNFEIKSKQGITAHANGNDLTVTIDELDFDSRVTFNIKDFEWKMSQNIVYKKPGSQTVLKASVYDPTQDFKIKFKLATGDLVINKKDEFGLSTIPGQHFGVWISSTDGSGNPTWEKGHQFLNNGSDWVTDANGKINLTGMLPTGHYIIEELSVTGEYVLNTETLHVEIKEDQVTETELINKLRDVEMDIIKKDSHQDDLRLNDARFTVTDITDTNHIGMFDGITGNQYIQIGNKENHNFPMANTEVEISETSDFANFIINETTNDQGMVDISLLEEGKYYYRVKNTNDTQEIDIVSEADYLGKLHIDNLKYGRTYNVCEIELPPGYQFMSDASNSNNKYCEVITTDYTDGEITRTYEFDNKLRDIDINVIKKDFDHNEILLNGAEFLITDITGIKLEPGDEDAATITDGIDMFKGVTGSQYAIAQDTYNYNHPMKNEPITIAKNKDMTGVVETINSDEFGVVNLNHLPVGKYYYSNASNFVQEINIVSADEYLGKLHVNNLKYGRTYRICETKPADGYEFLHEYANEDGKYCEVITLDAPSNINEYTYEYENRLRNLSLSVHKIDEEENWRYINGAEFLITDITDAGFIDNEETITVNYFELGSQYDFASMLNVDGIAGVTYHSTNTTRAIINELGNATAISGGHVNFSVKAGDEVINSIDVIITDPKDDKDDFYSEISEVDEGFDENLVNPGTNVFKGITGSQYIQVQDNKNHNYPVANVEVVITEDFERLEIVDRKTTDEFGLINVDEIKAGTYYWFIEDGMMMTPIEFEIKSKETVEGKLEVAGLKWGREYRACEVGLPDGYDFISNEDKEAGMSCEDFTMDLEFGIDNQLTTNSNILRKLDLKLYKTDPSKNILLNGAWFEVWDIYEDGINLGDQIDPEFPMPMIKTKEYLGEFVSGSLKIDDHIEVLIDAECEDTPANKKTVPNVGVDYMISETEDFSVYEIKTTNVSGQIVAYLPDGKYYSKKVAVEGDDLTEDVFQPKVHYVSKGTIMLPQLKYGHPYMICETKAPGGFYIDGDGCEVFTPTAEYGIERIENYRINEMIKIPVMGE